MAEQVWMMLALGMGTAGALLAWQWGAERRWARQRAREEARGPAE